jgi:hypothetical protein
MGALRGFPGGIHPLADERGAQMGSLSEKLIGAPIPSSHEARDGWFVVDSGVLKEPILYVPDPDRLAQAKSIHPNLVPYLMREIEALYNHRDNAELLQAVHRIKKKFGGHVRGDDGLSTS